VNAARREAQKQLDTLKNRQMGPKWTQAMIDYQAFQELELKYRNRKEDLRVMIHDSVGIEKSIQALHELGYIAHADSKALTRKDLTLKGILATEVNEGHPILLTELYTAGIFHDLTFSEIIMILACFHESKQDGNEPSLEDVKITQTVREHLYTLDRISNDCAMIDCKYDTGTDGYWDISTHMIDPLTDWMEGDSSSAICGRSDLFEGKFIRIVLKTANMVDELISMATYCQHVEFLSRLLELRQQLVREVIVSDSLYLHL
jgi:antiviral helicase SKI2